MPLDPDAKGIAELCLGEFRCILGALHDENLLRGLPRDVFVERPTYYLGEVNAIHPFREGNGPALMRKMLDELLRES